MISSVQRSDIIDNESNSEGYSADAIYQRFSLFLLGLIVLTLVPHFGKIVQSDTKVPMNFIVHSSLFLSWYVLFSVQSSLSATGKVSLHRKLGYISLALGGALFISSVDMLLGVMRTFDPGWTQGYLISRTSFVWGILHTTTAFFAFFGLALVFRRRLQIHKRLIVLAALSMVSASATRVAFLPFIPIDGTALTLLSTYCLLMVPIAIDKIRFKRVHSVLKWGVPVYIFTQIVCVGILPTTGLGQQIAFPF